MENDPQLKPGLLISAAQVNKIFPALTEGRALEISALINLYCPKFGIDTPLRLCHFLAQVAHESGEFHIKEEDMRYSTAARIKAVWPNRFRSIEAAQPYVRQPRALANYVYMREDLGNNYPDAGWLNRGGGFIQITGHDSYKRFADFLGEDLAMVRDKVRVDDAYAFQSACWEFAFDKKLLDEADRDEFVTITKRINGGIIGIEERERYLNQAKEVLM